MSDKFESFLKGVQPLKEQKPQVKAPRPNKPTYPCADRLPSTHTPTIFTLEDVLTRSKVLPSLPPIRRSLDLHNLRYELAESMTIKFIKESFQLNIYSICIITGKGLNGQGVLKESLPLWVLSPAISPYVLHAIPILEKNECFGSYHILLKKPTHP